MLSAEQQAAYTSAIAEAVAQARQALDGLARRNLNAEQRATADRVRTFLTQAEAARKDDLVRARSLAERANILAQDLLSRVQ